jgi:hypothetical protein
MTKTTISSSDDSSMKLHVLMGDFNHIKEVLSQLGIKYYYDFLDIFISNYDYEKNKDRLRKEGIL